MNYKTGMPRIDRDSLESGIITCGNQINHHKFCYLASRFVINQDSPLCTVTRHRLLQPERERGIEYNYSIINCL